MAHSLSFDPRVQPLNLSTFSIHRTYAVEDLSQQYRRQYYQQKQQQQREDALNTKAKRQRLIPFPRIGKRQALIPFPRTGKRSGNAFADNANDEDNAEMRMVNDGFVRENNKGQQKMPA